MKPIGSAQGKGIFLFTKLNEISEWKNTDNARANNYGMIYVLCVIYYICVIYTYICIIYAILYYVDWCFM